MLVLLKMNWLIYSETKTNYDDGNPEIRWEEQVTNQKPNNSLIALPLEIIYGPSWVLCGFVCLFVGWFLTIPKRGKEGSEKESVLPELTQPAYAADRTQM